MFGFFKNRRRKKLFERPVPDEWRAILDERFDFIDELDDEERERFWKHFKIFIWEKDWFPAKGYEITDEMKVVISACAARMARSLPLDAYHRIKEIVIYPGDYSWPDHEESHILGEAHDFGTVVLSWNSVKHGIDIPNDGRDTALHEFAHMLDLASGEFNGTPLLHKGEDYHSWAKVLTRHFLELQDAPTKNVLREYGATNEAEFFAVATEVFFEKPKTLLRKAPDLYEELANFYQMDPADSKSLPRWYRRRFLD